MNRYEDEVILFEGTRITHKENSQIDHTYAGRLILSQSNFWTFIIHVLNTWD